MTVSVSILLLQAKPKHWKRLHKGISHAFGTAHTKDFFQHALKEVSLLRRALDLEFSKEQMTGGSPETLFNEFPGTRKYMDLINHSGKTLIHGHDTHPTIEVRVLSAYPC